MSEGTKIIHIDKDYKVNYLVILDGSIDRKTLSLETATSMLNRETFDLIISEPHNIALFTQQDSPGTGSFSSCQKQTPDLENTLQTIPQ